MRKIISLIAALVIFSFSVFGETASAATCPCGDAAIEQTTVTTHVDASQATSFEKSFPLQSPAPLSHDCHFGHCGFTLIVLPAMSTPSGHVALLAELTPSDIPAGFRSETLRPPSRA